MYECYFEHSNYIARMTYGQSVRLTHRMTIDQLGIYDSTEYDSRASVVVVV